MSNSSHKQPHGTMPSEAQMDHLLHEFFRLEMPAELNRPFRHSAVNPVNSPVTLMRSAKEMTSEGQRNRRFVVVSAVSVLVLTLVVLVQRQDDEPRRAAPMATTIEQKNSTTSEPNSLMDVSTDGDLKSSDAAVGEDGLTLPEIDIENKPLR